ncbi:hypothetical protein NBRC110019_20330 [Neptunitalea chrysea]|uniref:VOC domain-containing protein n=1 Tax=Neptunitalea chrysea TaxID=1647581 RepID=A0A9W6B8P2_9FLAO|nr:VOC family protein [Neptunitalea chrysea]GLB52993.1 hypothetical protein NBRC110019_20330 [Neptunitalea chrysea]
MNLNQITVPSLEVTASIKFYKMLGLQLIVKSLPKYARFLCTNGGSTFSIHQVESLPSGHGIWVYFECDDVDATVEKLQSKGIMFDQLPTDEPWLWREARLKDPDGNLIVLYHAGENRANPPWRIN